MKYIPENFKIKMVEPVKVLTREEREKALEEGKYNLFLVKSDDVQIDFCTDSGTGAMSDKQWSGMMVGDESYAGGRSYFKLLDAIKDIFGYEYGQPVHQGRAAEKVLFNVLLGDDKVSISNMHFDTTRAHVFLSGAQPLDIVCKEAKMISEYAPFKGNIDLVKLEELIAEYGERVGMIVMTVTNNSAGGQPVSMANLRAASEIAKKNNIKMVIDAARFAENAFFIKEREEGYADVEMIDIVREMFSYADAFTMSAKKDAIVNMGGLIGVKDDNELYELVKAGTIPNEGFVTYGGLSGRDLEALAIGLYEGIEYDYLKYRIGQIQYVGEKLRAAGITDFQYPVGGHALFIDAGALLPHIPYDQFPGAALANELYLEAGIRGGDIGSFNFGTDPETGKQLQAEFEFCRLAVPRRVYTQAHFDMVADAIIAIAKRAETVPGYEITWEPKMLRHFTAHCAPVKK